MFTHSEPRLHSRGTARRLLTAAVAIGLLLAGRSALPADTAANAAAASGDVLELKTERVIVFKDGYSLIVKRGSAVTDDAGEVYTEQVPDAAVLGSFWALPSEGRVVSMRAGWETVDEKVVKDVPCTQNVEILQANKGKACKVELSDNKTALAGTIREVLLEERTESVPAVLRSSFGLPEAAGDLETISRIAGSHFILRTENGDVLLPVSQIRTLTIHDMNTTVERTVTTKKQTKRLTFRFEKPGQRRELLVMYFRPGLRWIPTYRIQLGDDKEKKIAAITLQAEILNEAEDLADVPVDIVVGVPNFRFRDLPSPLILEQTLRNALQQAAPQLMRQFSASNADFSNAMMSQRVAQVEPTAVPGEGSIRLPSELTTAEAQNLFVYNLPKLAFKKGERAAVGIFTAEVPYRDVYTWDLTLQRADIEASPSGAGLSSPLVLSKNEVWHQIELTNNTDAPWTTGAAIIMQGNQPLGQELLTYTSPKSAVRVPVTVSVDTRGSFAEEETDRKLEAVVWDNQRYAKIDKRAALRLHNGKSVAIDAEISLRFGGKFVKVSDEGTGTLNPFDRSDWSEYRGSTAMNNSSTIRWKTTIKPGEAFEPTVEYYFYARH